MSSRDAMWDRDRFGPKRTVPAEPFTGPIQWLEEAVVVVRLFAEVGHRDNTWRDYTRGRCASCGHNWPCPTARAVNLLERYDASRGGPPPNPGKRTRG